MPAAPGTASLYAPLRRWLDQLPPGPDIEALARLADGFPIHAENGRRIRFVPPRTDGLAYECRIWESGEVEMRPGSWHDYFNALVWLSFPRTKVAISAAHVRAMTPAGRARGSVRDALTHFDECGIVVVSTRPRLLDLLRDFRWKELFVDHRAEVLADMRFVVFGHAIYEQLLRPFRGLTAKAVLYEVDEDWLDNSPEELVAGLDGWLAADLGSGRYRRPRDFQPLPVLGIPGVVPESEDPAYYDDEYQFRPGRRAPVRAA